jgi:hypothetical protein
MKRWSWRVVDEDGILSVKAIERVKPVLSRGWGLCWWRRWFRWWRVDESDDADDEEGKI